MFHPRRRLTVHLRLATASETVVVSATRTPVPGEAAGADVDSLSAAQLTTMQPTAASDAVRFLPGRDRQRRRTARRADLALRARRRVALQQSDRRWRHRSTNPAERLTSARCRMDQADRMEFVRGAQSTLYGSDAMTSVVQVWTRDRKHAGSGIILRGGRRKFRHREWLRFAGWGARALRLQPVRQPVQYQRRRHQQRLFQLARGRECWGGAQ